MKRKRILNCNKDDIAIYNEEMKKEILSIYEPYIEKFRTHGIQMKIDFVYFYNKKFHLKKNDNRCFMEFRVRLFPSGMSYSQAQSSFTFQNFFSHKLLKISKTRQAYRITKYSTKDSIMDKFLNQYLNKAQTQSPQQVLKEKISDIFRSYYYAYRFQNEIKMRFRNFNLMWIHVFIYVIVLILFFTESIIACFDNSSSDYFYDPFDWTFGLDWYL